MAKKKVIFDTNIFSTEHFPVLEASKLKDLVYRKKILILSPAILYEQILHLWLNDKKRPLLFQYLPFLLDLKHQQHFHDRGTIITMELEKDTPSREDYFLSLAEKGHRETQINKQILQAKPDIFEQIQLKLLTGKHKQQRDNFRMILSKIRKTMSEQNKKFNSERSANFENIFSRLGESMAETLIDIFYGGTLDKNILLNNWKTNKGKYPFLTFWIRAFLYIAFHAATNNNTELDADAQNDVDFIVCMKEGNILVSEDQRFMKDTFNHFWGGSEKQLLRIQDFVSLIATF